MSDKKEKKSGFKDSLKSMDTEETFDLIFYRPIGYKIGRASCRERVFEGV